MNRLILLVFTALMVKVINRDTSQRDGISSALWIPTIWLGIIASRPVSMWFGAGGGDTLEGSPMDALIFLILIVSAGVVLSRRQVFLQQFIARNWPVTIFYLFLLVSVIWTHAPLSSLKRWTKEAGNIAVVLVILTEVNPLQAIRATFVRCGYVLIPLSLILLRYFPDLGRRYNIHSGGMEATGVTCQKNSLGAMILVCGLIIFWDLLEIWRNRAKNRRRPNAPGLFGRTLVLLIGIYLLSICDSKTSIVCLVLGAGILTAARLPVMRSRVQRFGMTGLIIGAAGMGLDQMFGIKDAVLQDLGRDASLTGRTDVWHAILGLDLDPIIGTGFMSFWDDAHYRTQLPNWVAFSAHNGYLEIYIAGGFVGLFFLALMLIGTAIRVHRSLGKDGDYAVLRFAVLVMTLLANISESNFACMTPLGFIFLMIAIDAPPPVQTVYFPEIPAIDKLADIEMAEMEHRDAFAGGPN